MSGLGIGDGFMSPPDSSVYAEYLFNLGLVGELERDNLLKWEDNMKYHASVGQYQTAWEVSFVNLVHTGKSLFLYESIYAMAIEKFLYLSSLG